MSQQLKIYSAGLNQEDSMVVNTAAKLLSYDDVNYLINDGDINKAHLIILDEDSAQGKSALRQSRAGQVKLVVSSKPGMAKNTIGLQRPVELTTLKTILKKLYTKLHGQLIAQQENTGQSDLTVTELKGTLFNLLLETKIKKRIVHLTSDDLPDIFIDGCNHCLATTASESQLAELFSLPIEQINFYTLNSKSFAVHSNEMSIQSLHNFLWLSGIKCSQGRLLPGHSLTKPFRLKAWPNFTRNTFIAEHLKLAAILAKQSLSLQQLSQTTGVKPEEVINFYNAAFAVDLIDYNTHDNQGSKATRTRSAAQQGLLSRIAKRLSLKNIF